jgi:hypothetical protein
MCLCSVCVCVCLYVCIFIDEASRVKACRIDDEYAGLTINFEFDNDQQTKPLAELSVA